MTRSVSLYTPPEVAYIMTSLKALRMARVLPYTMTRMIAFSLPPIVAYVRAE
jgi:hypothetical protein